MKFLSLLLIVLSLIACREEEGIWDELTQAEQDALRERSYNKCIAAGTDDIETFKENSNANLVAYQRGQYWKVELSKGDTLQSTDYVYVWKVDGTNIYFLYQKTNGTGFTYKFYKMTSAFNGEMVDDALEQKCRETYTTTTSSSTITTTFTDIATAEPPNNFESDYTYTAKSNQPMFFANLVYKQVKDKLDDNDRVVSTETYNYKITSGGVDTDLLAAVYTTYSAQYCLFDYVIDGAEKDLVFPYTDSSCTTSGAGPTNPGADATLNFVPTTELVL